MSFPNGDKAPDDEFIDVTLSSACGGSMPSVMAFGSGPALQATAGSGVGAWRVTARGAGVYEVSLNSLPLGRITFVAPRVFTATNASSTVTVPVDAGTKFKAMLWGAGGQASLDAGGGEGGAVAARGTVSTAQLSVIVATTPAPMLYAEGAPGGGASAVHGGQVLLVAAGGGGAGGTRPGPAYGQPGTSLGCSSSDAQPGVDGGAGAFYAVSGASGGSGTNVSGGHADSSCPLTGGTGYSRGGAGGCDAVAFGGGGGGGLPGGGAGCPTGGAGASGANYADAGVTVLYNGGAPGIDGGSCPPRDGGLTGFPGCAGRHGLVMLWLY